MTFTYDPTEPIGQVRMNIPDRTAADAFWTDEEIQVFLTQEGDSIKRATAAALEAMASDEAYVQKVMHLMDISTNGAAVSEELRARAKDLREQAEHEDAGGDDGAFDIAEMVYDPFSERERIEKEAQRDG